MVHYVLTTIDYERPAGKFFRVFVAHLLSRTRNPRSSPACYTKIAAEAHVFESLEMAELSRSAIVAEEPVPLIVALLDAASPFHSTWSLKDWLYY